MKIAIWIFCIFANALIATFVGYAGITLGGIPTALLMGGTIFLARYWCRKLDDRRGRKEREKIANSEEMKKRLCPKCGENIVGNNRYCSSCGTEISQ